MSMAEKINQKEQANPLWFGHWSFTLILWLVMVSQLVVPFVIGKEICRILKSAETFLHANYMSEKVFKKPASKRVSSHKCTFLCLDQVWIWIRKSYFNLIYGFLAEEWCVVLPLLRSLGDQDHNPPLSLSPCPPHPLHWKINFFSKFVLLPDLSILCKEIYQCCGSGSGVWCLFDP